MKKSVALVGALAAMTLVLSACAADDTETAATTTTKILPWRHGSKNEATTQPLRSPAARGDYLPTYLAGWAAENEKLYKCEVYTEHLI